MELNEIFKNFVTKLGAFLESESTTLFREQEAIQQQHLLCMKNGKSTADPSDVDLFEAYYEGMLQGIVLLGASLKQKIESCVSNIYYPED